MRPSGRPGRSAPSSHVPRPHAPPVAAADLLAARLAPLDPVFLELDDDSAAHAGHPGAAGGGGHFSLTVVSKAFSGVSRLDRHRLVLARVGDLIPHPVHALAIRAYAPDEFASPAERMSR